MGDLDPHSTPSQHRREVTDPQSPGKVAVRRKEAQRGLSSSCQDPLPHQSPCTHTVLGSNRAILMRPRRFLNECSALGKTLRAFTSWP